MCFANGSLVIAVILPEFFQIRRVKRSLTRAVDFINCFYLNFAVIFIVQFSRNIEHWASSMFGELNFVKFALPPNKLISHLVSANRYPQGRQTLPENRFSVLIWWAQVDSNHRPYAYQAYALTTWAMSPYWLDRQLFVSYPHPLVEMRRIELLTPCVQGRCSPSWATPPYQGFGYAALTFHFEDPQDPQNWTTWLAFKSSLTR